MALTPDQQKLQNNQNIPAGQTGSPFTVPSLDQLQPAKPVVLPTVQTQGTVPADSLVNGVAGAQKSLSDYIAAATPATTNLDNNYQSILDSITSLTQQDTGKTQALAQEKINAGVTDLNKQLTDINGQITVGNAAYQKLALEREAKKAALEANSIGTTSGVLLGQQGAVDRQYNSEQALKAAELGMLSARSQALAGNLQTALQIAQNSVDAKYAPIEDSLKVRQAQLEAIKPLLDKQQKAQALALERQYNDEQNKIAENKANQKAISEMIVNASAQGADPSVVDQASKAATPLEAAKLLGKYSGDYLKYEMLKEQIKTEKAQQGKLAADTAKTYADIKKIKSEIVNNNPNISPKQAGKYAGALSVILGSDKFTKEQKVAVTNAINNGQDPFAVIKNQAKNIMGQTNATKLDNYETAKAQIESIQSNLKTFYANGGNTGLFKGNYEKTLNSLGQVSDPKLVGLATEISSALQIYRNAVSGTAYSVQEGKDIASIFPGINKSEGLNEAVLAGRLQAFETSIDSTYRNVLGKSYDEIKNAEITPITTTTSTNNPFLQAIGQTNTFLSGSNIISGTTPTGLLNFNIPK